MTGWNDTRQGAALMGGGRLRADVAVRGSGISPMMLGRIVMQALVAVPIAGILECSLSSTCRNDCGTRSPQRSSGCLCSRSPPERLPGAQGKAAECEQPRHWRVKLLAMAVVTIGHHVLTKPSTHLQGHDAGMKPLL